VRYGAHGAACDGSDAATPSIRVATTRRNPCFRAMAMLAARCLPPAVACSRSSWPTLTLSGATTTLRRLRTKPNRTCIHFVSRKGHVAADPAPGCTGRRVPAVSTRDMPWDKR
jgi:hypothetical protein